MALGGVEIGIMKPMLAPSVAARAGASGSMPEAFDTAIATGTIMLAEAVFEVVSDRMMADAGEQHRQRERRGRRQSTTSAPRRAPWPGPS